MNINKFTSKFIKKFLLIFFIFNLNYYKIWMGNCPSYNLILDDNDSSKPLIELLNFDFSRLEDRYKYDNILDDFTKKMPNLRNLKLTRSLYITDLGLFYVSRNCHEIINLNLVSCVGISDLGINYICNGCPKIENLNLFNCPKLTDQSLSFIRNLERLKIINLGLCKNLTDLGLQSLCKPGSCLEDINISNCDKITSLGFAYIYNNCKNLEEIDFSVTNIDGFDVLIFFNLCPKLNKIKLCACPKINLNFVQEIRRLHPNCLIDYEIDSDLGF